MGTLELILTNIISKWGTKTRTKLKWFCGTRTTQAFIMLQGIPEY